MLRRPARAGVVVTLMHPRQDVTFHPLVPLLARGRLCGLDPGIPITQQRPQSVARAGNSRLRGWTGVPAEAGFAAVIPIGHSGGAALAAFYLQQAALPPDRRLTLAPSGRPSPSGCGSMPVPEGFVALAPHPGQGALLERVIDPSVVDESDPLSVDPALDAFNPDNGFRPAPASSRYGEDFIRAYRAGQHARIRRIDAARRHPRGTASAGQRTLSRLGRSTRSTGRAGTGARCLSPRTDADLRNVDLSLDPNRRHYGSLFGRRPDLTNYGLVGFGRLSTAEAWMSTWSANTTNANFLRCASDIAVPTLLLEFTGDQASFPSDIAGYARAMPAADLPTAVDGTHFGGPLTPDQPTGNKLAAEAIVDWMAERFLMSTAVGRVRQLEGGCP